jgi:hypothetical protein
MVFEKVLKLSFNSRVFQEVDKVVNVKAQCERMRGRTAGGVLWVTDKSGVKAGVFQGGGETNRNKNSINFVVPMLRTSTETIKCVEEEPIFLGIGLRVPGRRTNNSSFFWRENSVTEGIFTVSLTKGASFFYCKTDKETKRVAKKNWGKTIAFAPNSFFLIS